MYRTSADVLVMGDRYSLFVKSKCTRLQNEVLAETVSDLWYCDVIGLLIYCC
jgi:hypothetical protein